MMAPGSAARGGSGVGWLIRNCPPSGGQYSRSTLGQKRPIGKSVGRIPPYGGGSGMANVEPIEVEAQVVQALPNTMFRLEFELDGRKHNVLGHISGRLRKHFIRILPGDTVRVELSPYDLTRGRITRRL